jgi:hypothetical protein
MLRDDTAHVWEWLRAQPALTGFVLVGGTALALRIAHRISEDLDFAWTGSHRLPRPRLDALRRAASEQGHAFAANDDVQGIEDFEIAGMDLRDYQQDHLVDASVKVTFFAPDDDVRRHLASGEADGPRIAGLGEIFAMKCLVCADRSKTRDWFDLFILMRDHGFGASQFIDVFEASGVPQKAHIALGRLCSARPHALDEGFDSLLPSPPSLAEMAGYFQGVRDDVQREMARRRASGA